jgi:hypothetical protein
MDITAFRTEFPEFADTTAYPDSQLSFWASVAELQMDRDRWGYDPLAPTDMYRTGVKLYVAHEIVIARQNVSYAAVGGNPGQHGGIANSKSEGQVSIGFDSSTQTEKDAGWWNRTTYGIQYVRLMRIFGTGTIQL